MCYRITVMKNGQHYFSTDTESPGEELKKASALYRDISRRFPRTEGFSVLLFEVVRNVLTVQPL